MLRFNRVVCVLAVGALVGVAFGAVIKIKGLTPVGSGITESPDADGMAIVHYKEGKQLTEVNVAITDFMPETDYYIAVEPGIAGAPVTTNPSGNAHYHGEIGWDICAWEPQVCVYVWIDDDGSGLFTPGEKRAEGCTPCP
jgi:hypothetical protein